VRRSLFSACYKMDPLSLAGLSRCALWASSAASSPLNVGYTYTKELYHTSARTTGLGIGAVSARLGSASFPFIGGAAAAVRSPRRVTRNSQVSQMSMDSMMSAILPVATYGVFLLLASLASIWIWPETNSTLLPDTVDDAEALASSPNSWTTCRRGNAGRAFSEEEAEKAEPLM